MLIIRRLNCIDAASGIVTIIKSKLPENLFGFQKIKTISDFGNELSPIRK